MTSTPLSFRKSLPDTLVSIELKLQRLGWITVHRIGCRRIVTLHEPRLVFWTVGCLQATGYTPEKIASFLAESPPERHWWLLRQLLPDEALYVLDAKLDQFLTLE